MREIVAAVGLRSTSAVAYQLKALEKMGYLTRGAGKPRIMRLPGEMVGSGVLFAVRVVGDSMVNASIFDGDCVVVRQQEVADNGDIVAALIGEEAYGKDLQARRRPRLADAAKPQL